MLETGLKQAIINNTSQIVYDDTLDVLTIEGVARIEASNINKLALLDTSAEVPGQYTLDFTGAQLNWATGDLLTYAVYFDTYRNQGEYASNLKQGVDPWVLQFTATGATTTTLAADLASAISAASAELKARYKVASAAAAAGVVTIVMTEWSPKVNKCEVNGVSGIQIDNVLATIAVIGQEGRGLPKYLEESVKTDTRNTRSNYALENDMQLDMNATYAQLNLEVQYQTEGPSGNVLNSGPITRTAFFNIWINRSTYTDAVLATNKIINTAGAATDTNFLVGDVNGHAPLQTTEELYASLATASVQDIM